jgi:hypothetical protein
MRFLKSLGLAALFGVIVMTGLSPTGAARADVEPMMAVGVNMPGSDIASYPLQSPDPAFCRLACDQNPQCQGWTFIKPGIQGPNAVCWLKSRNDIAGVADQNAISAIKTGASGPYPGGARVENDMALGVDLHGGDLANFVQPSGDPQVCRQACLARADCRAWSFLKPGPQGPQAICFLKRMVPGGVFNNGVISGMGNAAGAVGGGGGGGAGGVTPGTLSWGVWAYRASGSNWADPCSIQYVASPIGNARYAGNPSMYILVRMRETQRDADLDINAFSRFFQNQPDGIVKLTACDNGNGGGGGGGAGGGPSYASWMTGTFDSTNGLMQLGPGGGSYANYGGQLSVTRVQGNIMEGTWTQTASGGQCPDGRHRGRFRFDFTENGFTGTWSYCDQEPTRSGFSGTRRK